MKPHVFKTEDGCVSLEWIDREHRFGITLEKDRKESGWYLVGKCGVIESGVLPEKILVLFKDSTEMEREGECIKS